MKRYQNNADLFDFSFVPAKTAKIGLIDRIVTRIKTVESTGKGDSSFMIDLRQVKAICDTITDRSLILIDEFGKGKLNITIISCLYCRY